MARKKSSRQRLLGTRRGRLALTFGKLLPDVRSGSRSHKSVAEWSSTTPGTCGTPAGVSLLQLRRKDALHARFAELNAELHTAFPMVQAYGVEEEAPAEPTERIEVPRDPWDCEELRVHFS